MLGLSLRSALLGWVNSLSMNTKKRNVNRIDTPHLSIKAVRKAAKTGTTRLRRKSWIE